MPKVNRSPRLVVVTPIGGPPTDVNLNPGQLAEALIQGSDGSIGRCGYFSRSFLRNATELDPVGAGDGKEHVRWDRSFRMPDLGLPREV
jgi:hypothetical protein